MIRKRIQKPTRKIDVTDQSCAHELLNISSKTSVPRYLTLTVSLLMLVTHHSSEPVLPYGTHLITVERAGITQEHIKYDDHLPAE